MLAKSLTVLQSPKKRRRRKKKDEKHFAFLLYNRTASIIECVPVLAVLRDISIPVNLLLV